MARLETLVKPKLAPVVAEADKEPHIEMEPVDATLLYIALWS
jgi:hypothetical protein